MECPARGAGVVTAEDDKRLVSRCLSLWPPIDLWIWTIYRYDVHKPCVVLPRDIGVEDGVKQHFPVLHDRPGWPGTTIPEKVHKAESGGALSIGEIQMTKGTCLG